MLRRKTCFYISRHLGKSRLGAPHSPALHYTCPSTNVTKPSPGTPMSNQKTKAEGQTQSHPFAVPHGAKRFDLNLCEGD